MRRIGLALSGGGFRATLYHLGVVRFLRDADLLNNVTHIASVSGGSILAAHVVLNWNRYTGSDKDFADAANEVIELVRFDLRNHIVRRMPFQFPSRLLHRFSLGKIPQLTSNGMLEKYYEKMLYGDTCLFELPKTPELHILSTNVSEGGLSAFSRSGLYVQRRRSGVNQSLEFVPGKTASISKVVGASSAFPGFFPPVQITAEDLGVREGLFPTEAFTDGGVYDNLGLRAFSWLKQRHASQSSTVKPRDFSDFDAACQALTSSLNEDSSNQLTWIAHQLSEQTKRSLCNESSALSKEAANCVAAELSSVIRRCKLHREDVFASPGPLDEIAAKFHRKSRESELPANRTDQTWLNRHLIASAFERKIGQPSLTTFDRGFDEILVSDAGKPFRILSDTSLGFLAQSVRASDILWDRVWQLERENFGKTPSFLFIPITESVGPSEDPTALSPIVQSEVQSVRTDLDRFTPLEISSLVAHGYEVARKVCKGRTSLVESGLPSGPPWDPFADPAQGQLETAKSNDKARSLIPSPQRTALAEADDARRLRRSARRKIWGSLVDLRDWTTYLYLLLLTMVVVVFPLQVYKLYKKSQMQATIIESFVRGDPDMRKVLEVVDINPLGNWQPMTPAQVPTAADYDYSGLEVLTHTRIIDLRQWRRGESLSMESDGIYLCDRMSIRKQESYAGDGRLVLRYPFSMEGVEVRVPKQKLQPIVRRVEEPVTIAGQSHRLIEVEYDLKSTPLGEAISVEIEFVARDIPTDVQRSRFLTELKTDVVSVWMLFPVKRPYETYSLVSYAADGTEVPRMVDTRFRIDHPYGSLIGWSVVNPEPHSFYECRWTFE